jgi:hypothetical protein
MKIKTESGATYNFRDGLCIRSDSNGVLIEILRPRVLRSVPDDTPTWDALFEIDPTGEPRIGDRMHLIHSDGWYLSTRVVSIERDPNDDTEQG